MIVDSGDVSDVRHAADVIDELEELIAFEMGRKPKRERFTAALRRLADKLDGFRDEYEKVTAYTTEHEPGWFKVCGPGPNTIAIYIPKRRS